MKTSRFSLLASRFSLLASRFSLLASRFSLLASRFSLLASRFSLLASRFSLLAIIVIMGCQKDNIESYVGQENFLKPLNSTSNENLFFDINNASRLLYENGVNTRTGNVPDILTACRDKLYEQNNMYDFVDSVVERIGYPVWLNSLIEQSLDSSLQVIYIPFVKQNSNHIEALLRAVSPSQIDTSTLNFEIVTDYELVQMDRGELSYNENTCQDVLRFAAFNYQMFNDTSRFQTLLQKSCFSQSPPESPYSYHQLNNRSECEELEITYCFFLNEDSPYTSSNWGGGSPGGWSYVYGGTNGFSNPGFTIVYGGNFGTYSGEGGYGGGATLVNCNDAATTGFLDFLAGIFCDIGDFFEQIFSCGGAKCPPEPFNNPTSIVDLRYNEPEYICQTYLVTVCNDGEWWEIVESIPCPDCDGNLTPDEYLAHQCQNDMLSFGKQHCGLLKLVKQKNIDLSGFCSETGFDTQAALMAVMGLTTEQQTWLASNPTLFDDVVAFLDDKCWDEGAVDLVNTTIDVFPEMLEWMITQGLDEDQQVVIKTEDFMSMDESARVNHIYKWLRLIRRFEECGIAQCCRHMKIDGDFFTNVDYTGSNGMSFIWQANVVSTTGLEIPIKLEWTVAWNEQRFVASPIGPYGTLDPDQFKLVYPKLGSSDPQFGVITIYYNSAYSEVINEELSSPNCN
ncbi:MAG: hypothetical protein KatS3mg030_557 [Saprospiraceae bacterium]|nr:MAG: hypothetical protein KatS3mg030_557 [Saprospiraceae bacterium]